jgi:hypothetical protein
MGTEVFPTPPQKVLIFSYEYGAFWRIFIMGFETLKSASKSE